MKPFSHRVELKCKGKKILGFRDFGYQVCKSSESKIHNLRAQKHKETK